MKGQLLIGSNTAFAEPNIYADKSSLVLEWLLLVGVAREQFSIREVAAETGISLGQVQKVVGVLTMNGCLQAVGIRTAKKFVVKKPQVLFKNWLEYYNIVKKCKMRTYRSGLQGRDQLLNALSKSPLHHKVALALHSAAEALRVKNTNLETLELYLLDAGSRSLVEETLQLEPQERGYEVLVIEPYYKSMVNRIIDAPRLKHSQNTPIRCTPPLLTLLDLYHFPLRGPEQAEFMAERIPALRHIYKKDH